MAGIVVELQESRGPLLLSVLCAGPGPKDGAGVVRHFHQAYNLTTVILAC